MFINNTDLEVEKVVDAILQRAKIVVIPTDTVYGVVARATDKEAVKRLYHLKQREHKPGTIIAANIDQLVALGMKRRYLTAVTQFWPGPISVIIPCGSDLEYLHQGVQSLAVRLPIVTALQSVLIRTGPLVTSSANQPGQEPAHIIQEAQQYFGDGVDYYFDGGDLSGQKPSTVIRIVDDAIEVVRQGAIKIDNIGRKSI
jgi:L-threonylcarbamoyladenylate synthase